MVEPELRRHGHDVVAVSLPAADETAGLPEYADAVIDAVGERDRTDLALVAQSLAGFTAPLICKRLPLVLLVLLNAMIPKPGETPGEWWAHTNHGEAKRQRNLRDHRSPEAQFDPRVDFFHDVPQHVVDEAFAQEPPRQSDAVFATPCTFDSWPDVPTKVLVGRDDRFFPVEFQRRIARERLGISPDEMPGGHLVALSQPAELAKRLDAYAADIRERR